jgi:hypothetical protein
MRSDHLLFDHVRFRQREECMLWAAYSPTRREQSGETLE